MPAPRLPCNHCRALVPRLDADDRAFEAVVRALRGGSRTLASAELSHMLQCPDADAQAWVDHLMSCAHAWPTAERDREVLRRIELAFDGVSKPWHFTDYRHCPECKEHDDTLRARTRDTLQRKDLGHSGWDPMNFCSAEGIGYFFPALARYALLPAVWDDDWYGVQLLWHLSYAGGSNRFLRWCSPSQRDAVRALLRHLMETRLQDVANHGEEDALVSALSVWGPPDAPSRGAKGSD